MNREILSEMRSITDQDYDKLLKDVNYELETIALEKQAKEQRELQKLYGTSGIDEGYEVERRGERMAEAYENRFRRKVIRWMEKEVAGVDSELQKMNYQAIKRNGIRLVD